MTIVPADVPFDALASVGCAVVTGVGAVLNAARVPKGAVVVVVGAGGVGINVVQGAVLADSSRIIVIDRQEAPLAIARALGATDTLHAPESIVKAVKDTDRRPRRRLCLRHRRFAGDAG